MLWGKTIANILDLSNGGIGMRLKVINPTFIPIKHCRKDMIYTELVILRSKVAIKANIKFINGPAIATKHTPSFSFL